MSGWTLAFQVVNFLILALLLHRFLFKPVTAMIVRRQREIEAASKEAETTKRTAEESRARYDAEREKLMAEREKLLGELRGRVAQERDKTLGQARAEAATILEAARAEIARERGEAAARLADTAVGLAVDLAKRLLEQAAGADIAETLLQRACDHLESMPPERLRSLRDELKSSAAALEVATSPALAAEAEVRWGHRIAKDLDVGTAVRFVADAALVAGAELRFPHTKLSFCWRDGLNAAREELADHADRR
jgi:F-type H+-transporting ATPase subunit b